MLDSFSFWVVGVFSFFFYLEYGDDDIQGVIYIEVIRKGILFLCLDFRGEN